MEDEVADDDYLLRRIPPPGQMVCVPAADGTQRWRPSSSAFRLRKGEAALSFNLERSLRAANESLTYGCPPGCPGWAVVRVRAGALRAMGLIVRRDPDPAQPFHVLVTVAGDTPGRSPKSVARDIALHAEYIILPLVP